MYTINARKNALVFIYIHTMISVENSIFCVLKNLHF